MTSLKQWMAAKLFGKPEQTLPLLRRLIAENASQYKYSYLAAFACMAVVAVATGASAWIMKDIINRIFIEKDEMMVWLIAGGVASIYAVKGIFTYAQEIILVRIGSNVIANLQHRVFDQLLRQTLDFYQKISLGELAIRMSNNVQATRTVIHLIVTSIGRDFLSLIALIAVMISMDPLMSLITLVIMPAAVLGVSSLIKRVKEIMKLELKTLARIISNIQETSAGIRVVKAFNLEERMRMMMAISIRDLRKRSNKIATMSALTGPLMETLGGIAVALVIIYGGWSVISQGSDPGAFFAFITALLMAYEPAKRLARLNVQLQANIVPAAALYKLLDRPITTAEVPDAVELQVRDGNIRFEDVSFSYGKTVVLQRLVLDILPRSVTALVGPSGAGKTTIFALIERFYDPKTGEVKIDGQNIRAVTFESLRRQIALVTQDTFLFDGTVLENISYGKMNASRNEIIEAAKNANAHDFILELQRGYETQIGEGGARLSGGQRQRIAIARAMLRNAPILLLDEPTSALDAQSEFKVQEALDRLMRNRTTIVIAHRLSTVQNADKIYVIDKGKVLQSGSHSELIAEGGLYAHLYALQFREPLAKVVVPAGAS